MKSEALDPEIRTLTLATSDGDDDDFQDPIQAISITQNLILSSLANPSSQPLRPSNGARSRKRTKPSGATGKENRRIPPILRSDPKVSNGCKADKLVIPAKRDLSATAGPDSVNIPPISSSTSHISSDCDQMKSNSREDVTKEDNLCFLPPFVSKAVDTSSTTGNDSDILRAYAGSTDLNEGKTSYHSMSIEARLLESIAKTVSSTVEAGSLKGNGCMDFEPGTQLNSLIDLCCKMDEQGISNCGNFSTERNDSCIESSELQGNGSVECPLCGIDITGLSEELRQVHTNDCLDKEATLEVTANVGEIKPNLPRQEVDFNSVLEWLRALGLSKYEEDFVREEIDWETLQWLTEEDLLSIGVTTLGPRKKIAHALNELRKRNNHPHDTEKGVSETSTNKKKKPPVPGNALITEYFGGAAANRNIICNVRKPHHVIEKSKHSNPSRVGIRNCTTKGKFIDVPAWCCISGTPFRVDAFRYLRRDCSHWFLTHFHLDHYQGLTRNFSHGKIYCSSITAHLVNMKIGVAWDRLHILPINQRITIAGVDVTCLDANHCPGSIILLFQPPNGKAVLHTGDFRFSSEMASSSILQECHVHTLILDTTYCKPEFDFPKQDAVIQFVIEAIQAEAFNTKTLFLIGTYTIGKERLFLEVARVLRKKIYVGAAKLSLLRCLELPEVDMQWFTANEMESQIHVVPLWTIASFKRMKHISNQYSNRFNLIVAFSPTGWTFDKGKKKSPGRRWQQGTIIRYEVPYSEHCSFTELREFVQFISPEHIIPSVNNDGPESADAMIAALISDS